MFAVETYPYKGITIKIHTDDSPESPRDWDNLGTMVCFHSRYNLGDDHNMDVEESKEFIERKDIVALPLYLYDHNDITIRTGPFSSPWDSGMVGFIYVDHETIKKEYGDVNKETIEHAQKVLIGEVEIYDQYITGDVYGYEILNDEESDDVIDSCWGYFGIDACKEAAQESADYLIEEREKEKQDKRKAQIKNHVPLSKRA